MSRFRQSTQVYNSNTYDDQTVIPSVGAAASYELTISTSNLELDMNNLRTLFSHVVSGSNGAFGSEPWYQGLSGRGVNTIDTDLESLENKTVLCRVSQDVDVTVAPSDDHVVLSAPTQTPSQAIAIGNGIVTLPGAVVAQLAGAVGTASIDSVAASNAASPKNLCILIDANTGDVLEDASNNQIFGLLQVGSAAVDGGTFDNANNAAQISFVTFDLGTNAFVLSAIPAGVTDIRYAYVTRNTLEAVPEDCFLGFNSFVDGAASVDVTLSNAYANQGTTPAPLATNIFSQVPAAATNRSWSVTDSSANNIASFGTGAAATDLEVVLGTSAGGVNSTTTINGDDLDINVANSATIANGMTFEGTPAIDVGVTDGLIQSTGALSIDATSGGLLTLQGAGGITGTATGGNIALTASTGAFNVNAAANSDINVANGSLDVRTSGANPGQLNITGGSTATSVPGASVNISAGDTDGGGGSSQAGNVIIAGGDALTTAAALGGGNISLEPGDNLLPTAALQATTVIRSSTTATFGQDSAVLLLDNVAGGTGGGRDASVFVGNIAPSHDAQGGSIFHFSSASSDGALYINTSTGVGNTWEEVLTSSSGALTLQAAYEGGNPVNPAGNTIVTTGGSALQVSGTEDVILSGSGSNILGYTGTTNPGADGVFLVTNGTSGLTGFNNLPTDINSAAIDLQTGSVSGIGESGGIVINTGSASGSGDVGAIIVGTGQHTGSATTGSLTLETGANSGTGISGTARLQTGNSTAAESGGVLLSTGSAGTTSGIISLSTGNATGSSGNIVLTPGDSSGAAAGATFIFGGNSGGSSDGGGVAITGGTGGPSGGEGGRIVIQAGDGGSTTGDGADVEIDAGSATTNGLGGNVILRAGNEAGGNDDGRIRLLSASGALDQSKVIAEMQNFTTGGQSFQIYAGAAVPTHNAESGSLFSLDDGTTGALYVNDSVGGSGVSWSQLLTTATISLTLQGAYEGGNTITTSAPEGPLTVSGTEAITLSASASDVSLSSDLYAILASSGDTSGGGVAVTTEGVSDVFAGIGFDGLATDTASLPIRVQTGTTSGTGDSGQVVVGSGSAQNGSSGAVTLSSGAQTGGLLENTGAVTVQSGPHGASAGNSGQVTLATGPSTNSSSGDLAISTGASDAASGDITIGTGTSVNTGLGATGSLVLSTGTATTGDTGPISLVTGNASSAAGGISGSVGTSNTTGEIINVGRISFDAGDNAGEDRGGDIILNAGDNTNIATAADGGNVEIFGGDAAVGDGGDITFTPGSGGGASTTFGVTETATTFVDDVPVFRYTNAAAGIQRFVSDASPEGSITGNPGDICHVETGIGQGQIYLKESGTGNTGWSQLATGGSTLTRTYFDGIIGFGGVPASTDILAGNISTTLTGAFPGAYGSSQADFDASFEVYINGQKLVNNGPAGGQVTRNVGGTAISLNFQLFAGDTIAIVSYT